MLSKPVNELTIGDLQSLNETISEINKCGFGLQAISSCETRVDSNPYCDLVGKPVFIRTVTMYYTGRLLEVFSNELVISEASWRP